MSGEYVPPGGVPEAKSPVPSTLPDDPRYEGPGERDVYPRLTVGVSSFVAGLLLLLAYLALCTGGSCGFPPYFWVLACVPLVIGAAVLLKYYQDRAEKERKRADF